MIRLPDRLSPVVRSRGLAPVDRLAAILAQNG